MFFSKTPNPVVSCDTLVSFHSLPLSQTTALSIPNNSSGNLNIHEIECNRFGDDTILSILDDNLYKVIVPGMNKKTVFTVTETINTEILESSSSCDLQQESPLPIMVLINSTLNFAEQCHLLNNLNKNSSFVFYIMLITVPCTRNLLGLKLTVQPTEVANEKGRIIRSTKSGFYYLIDTPSVFIQTDKDDNNFEKQFVFSLHEFEVRHINKKISFEVCGFSL